MSFYFNPQQGTILVAALVSGPRNRIWARLAIDTGASMTVLDEDLVRNVGFDPATAAVHHQISTASGVESAAEIILPRFQSLGQVRSHFPVLGLNNLTSNANLDGLLGLDFFRGLTLILDFRAGQITLA